MTGRTIISTEVLSAGNAGGELLRLDEPLSFWGGTDAVTGTIIDPHHPQRGRSVAGMVLALPSGRGSSSSTTVLAEQIRRSSGPRAILLRHRDPVIALAAVVCRELYDICIPIVVLAPTDFDALPVTASATIHTERGIAELRIGEPAEGQASE